MKSLKQINSDKNVVRIDAYEDDPRFIEYIQMLVEHSKDERNLVSSAQVFAGIREKYGW